MTGNVSNAPRVCLEPIRDSHLDTLFEHQADLEAAAMAAVTPRDRSRFDAHWAKLRRDDTVILRTVVADGVVAGGVTSWLEGERRLVGYWIGREHWGRGIATRALSLFVAEVPIRPLYAHVAVHNASSIRVLRKCHFRPASAREAPDPEDGVEELVLRLAG
ncbi:GNAT family N-acetyltransferase [Streptomyces angustmyceticus]|uniref:GNAT family N-acetyltransferase n=1 Tax=Streptomyces angustmyceticus TaxID=285578 RepID=UPI003D91CF20